MNLIHVEKKIPRLALQCLSQLPFFNAVWNIVQGCTVHVQPEHDSCRDSDRLLEQQTEPVAALLRAHHAAYPNGVPSKGWQ